MSKAKLLEKLIKYGVSGSGLRVDQLEILLKKLKKYPEIEYEGREEIEYYPIDVDSCPKEEIKRKLKRNGWCVVDVPNWDNKYKDDFEEIIESFCPFRFDDPNTWMAKNLPPHINGILKNDLGHTELQWELREKMIPVFSEIYDTEDLLCSFDSMNLSFKRRNDAHGKLHVDQDYTTKDLECYQGVVNLVDNSDLDGGFLVLHKSHLVFDEYLETNPRNMFGWREMNMGNPLLKDLKLYKINLKAGQAVIWNSKTIHTNCQPLSDNLRCAVYISMMSREGAYEEDIEKRIKYFEEKRITNHWSYFGLKVNPKNPIRWCNNPRAPVSLNIDNLNDIQKRLVGYDV